MPLSWLDSKPEKRCSAKAKSKKKRCLNPVAYGCRTCRLHGAGKKNSIKRGEEHANYRHGLETLTAKTQRKTKLHKLRIIEYDLKSRGIIQ